MKNYKIWLATLMTTMPCDKVKRLMRLGNKFAKKVEFHYGIDDAGVLLGTVICDNYDRIDAIMIGLLKMVKTYNAQIETKPKVTFTVIDLTEAVVLDISSHDPELSQSIIVKEFTKQHFNHIVWNDGKCTATEGWYDE